MTQSRERGAWLGACAGALALLLAAASCVGGGRYYSGGFPPAPVVEFGSPGCSIRTQAGVALSDARLFMVHGRKAYSLLVLDQKGKGIEIENYWKDQEGHHFVTYKEEGAAWHYTFPDRRGASGKISRYTEYKLKDGLGYRAIEGEPTGSCKLEFVSAEPLREPVASGSAAAPAAPAALSCTPGETRECVGSGACRGGQFCLQDGSAFSVCDCGSVQPAPEASGAPAASAAPVSPQPSSVPGSSR